MIKLSLPESEVPYPQGNKLYACAATRAAPATILFDTDMFMLRPAFLEDALRVGAVSGRPTGDWMLGKTVDAWRAAYGAAPWQAYALQRVLCRAKYVGGLCVAYHGDQLGRIWRYTALAIEVRRLAKGIIPRSIR